MGFDNECILNIQSLAGEYFCPVCRTLVYPNEALQSQCTHLYCKPCLAYVVSSTQACPYDGYLVTEAGSKPLTESNKALAETIGKIAVHCLYHRSGCTWQGSLSECTSHCSGCAFGNSPVVCNRCGVQIVHRQVQEHAQTCNVNGANAQTQLGMESVQDSTTSGAVVPSEQSKSVTQQGVQASQSQAPQTVSAPPPGQNPNQQGIVNPQPQAVAPSAAPTPEQWYQYQQYYQQYPGYDPYQQAFQQYYPYQPQAAQQFQQQPPLLQGQPQPQVQAPGQAQPLPQVQPQAQAQLPSHTQAQPQNVPHGHPQPQLYAPAPMASQNQTQAQPNQPQHLHPAVQPHPQVQSQTHLPPPPPPHGLIPPQPYSQAPPHSGQTHPQQHMQGPQIQYQQAHAQMHHPQAGHLQPHPYAQGHPQAQYTSHAQSHPQTHPQQTNQPPTLNAQPQNHPSSIQSVTGHHSYPQPHGQQQMQPAPPQQQHMMHIQSSGGSLPPTQVQSQFPQPPVHVRPPPPHGFPSNQQPQALLPSSQGQASSIPLAQQQIHPNNQQPGPSAHQRPIMQPIQQQMPQQYVQQPQPFTGQVSTQNQVHPSHFTTQQAQLRPQGPPQAMQQHPLAYGQPQQTVAVPHGMQPNQSQNLMARPIMPNHGIQQFPQSTGALGVPPQVRPPQHNASQLSGNPNYVNTINNQLQTSSEQPFVQSGFLANSKVAERKGDQTSEKSVEQKEAGSPSQKPIEKDVIGVGADLAEGKSGLGMKSVGNEHNPSSEGDDSYKHEETLIKDAASEGYQGKDASGDPLIRQRLSDGKESTFDHSPRGNSLQSGSVAGKDATGAPLKHAEKNVINASLQASAEGGDRGPLAAPLASIQNVIPQGNSQPLNGKDHLQHGPGGDESAGFQGKGFEQSSHPAQFADHGIRQLPPMPYGPSGHQQRPTVPSMLQTGIPSNGQVPGHLPLGPLGPRLMPQPGLVLNPPEYLQPPAPKQPGPFHPDITLGGVPEAGSTASYGRGPSQFGNTQRSVELQYGAPLGQYNQGPIPSSHSGLSRMSQGEPVGPPMSAVHPGSFESQDRMIGRAPMLRGPEGQIGPPRPIAPVEGDFHNHRPPHFDGRRSDSHVPGSLEKGPFGQPFGSESNLMGMNGAAGGMRDERFKAVEDHSNPFPNRRLDQAEFHDSLKQPPRPSHMGSEASPKFGNNFLSSRPMDGGPQGLGVDGPSRGHDKGTPGFNYDTGRNVEPSASGAPGRFLPPYRPGALHPSDSGERVRAVGNYDDNRGRSDSGRLDFLGPAPGFNRHHMDGLPPRSPGREYLGNQSRPFGGFSGSIDDIDGRETHPFGEGSRSFNLPSDSVGHSIQESRFPVRPPGHMRRGEFDGPGNMRMGEHLRSGDLIGQEVLPSHLRRGELFNPRNLSGHPPLGEPGFGSFQGYGRITEAAGPGGFHPRPFGEPFGDSDSFDKLRKWKSVSTGWCRICKVDCETVEGLDMHSQTREHQKMTMDMVISIKQKNSKKQKTSNDHSAREEGSKSRNSSFQGRGKKP